MARYLKRAAVLLAAMSLTLFAGCTSSENLRLEPERTVTLSMAISTAAPESVKQAAQEFANRLAYYSDGELEVVLSQSAELGNVLSAGDTAFAFVENERLVDQIEELKTLELPFFFKHADYQFTALNSERTRARLNQLIGEVYPMQVQMATVCGYEDLAADGTVDLTDFRKRYPLAVTESFFSDELQQEIGALEIETDRPLALLLEGGAEIAQTDLSELIRAVSSPDFAGEMVLFKSAHKVKTAYLLVQDGLMETLTSKQQAAVEQAAVMACGYCRTLTDQQRESQLDELEELGASVQEINLEKYFAGGHLPVRVGRHELPSGRRAQPLCAQRRGAGNILKRQFIRAFPLAERPDCFLERTAPSAPRRASAPRPARQTAAARHRRRPG